MEKEKSFAIRANTAAAKFYKGKESLNLDEMEAMKRADELQQVSAMLAEVTALLKHVSNEIKTLLDNK